MEDVDQVNKNFDLHDIPCDCIWLDIEHTNGKRYFTWDQTKFEKPLEMIDGVASKGRKMVTVSSIFYWRLQINKVYCEFLCGARG